MTSTFFLGINYWPATTAMAWWKEFDPGQVDADFARIAAGGIHLVRFFLLWEDFQPEPDRVDNRRLRDLVTVMDLAGKHGLHATPTLLVGNMSGVMWFPPWAFLDTPERGSALQIAAGKPIHRELRSPFADQVMLLAETRLAHACARAIAGHPALHSWDLANELDQACPAKSPGVAADWVSRLAAAIREEQNGVRVTYGAHDLSLTTRGLTIPAIAPALDYLSMHGYPIYSDVARGPLDPEFVPFVTTLTSQLGGKPALMQEFGLPTAPPGQSSHFVPDDFLGAARQQFLASEEDAAAYYAAVLERLWQTGSMGAVPWDYIDYDRAIWIRSPLDLAHRERTFGLFHADGSPKAAAAVVRRFSAELSSGMLEERLGRHGGGSIDLAIDRTAYYRSPATSFRAAYAVYLERIVRREV